MMARWDLSRAELQGDSRHADLGGSDLSACSAYPSLTAGAKALNLSQMACYHSNGVGLAGARLAFDVPQSFATCPESSD